MIVARGGSRHHSKPVVDSLLLLHKLHDHHNLVKDLGVYESLSRSGAADPRGLVHNLDLLKGLLEIERSAEIHPNPLKNALLNLLTKIPSLNQTHFNGSVWVAMRAERITTLLNHLRKFARDPDCLKSATCKLSGGEISKIQELLNMMDLKEQENSLPLEGSTKDETIASENEQFESLPCKKVLKKEISNVSVDSSGYPSMLSSPCKRECSEQEQVAVPRRRRVGSHIHLGFPQSWGASQDAELKTALGFQVPETKAMKKPAALKKDLQAEPPEATLPKDERSWWKLQKTKASNPERTYITGNKKKVRSSNSL